MSQRPDQLAPLECIEISPPGGGRSSVIWLHGLGADGHDFEPIVPQLGLPQTRFIFPHAPIRPVTLNGGMKMRAWYDILSLDRDEQDLVGIRESAQQVEALIQRELERGRKADEIILAGFSQGGAMALHVGLRFAAPLAGVLALSCYLPVGSTFDEERPEANKAVPILMAHGRFDPVVPTSLGEESRDFLKEKGHGVQWLSYPIGHGVSPEEIVAVGRWMGLRLP